MRRLLFFVLLFLSVDATLISFGAGNNNNANNNNNNNTGLVNNNSNNNNNNNNNNANTENISQLGLEHLLGMLRESLPLVQQYSSRDDISASVQEATKSGAVRRLMNSAVKHVIVSRVIGDAVSERSSADPFGTQSLLSLSADPPLHYIAIGFLIGLLLIASYVALYVRARRAENRKLRKMGKHSFRAYLDCTPEELQGNKKYLLDRGAWNPGNILHHERTPPTPNCKYAAIVESVAFSDVQEHGGWSQAYLERGGLGHTGVMYFYEGSVEGKTSKPNEVLVSEMCHSFFCDVPEEKDIPEVEKHYLLGGNEIYQDPYYMFSVYDHVALPVGTCTYALEESELDETRWVVIREPQKLLFGVWPDPNKKEWQFDCQLMFEAEQTAYKKFDFSRSWVYPFHDCNLHGVMIKEALREYYQNPARPQSKHHVNNTLEEYVSTHHLRLHPVHNNNNDNQ